MSQQMGLIRPLPKEVAEQIKSSTTISSLYQVVCGLLENALEAQADTIDASVDFQLGSCVLEDNGVGISPNEFEVNGGLCKPYHTSKFDDSYAAGLRTGTFLASLASLSTLTITSHHHADRSHATLILHHSKPAARLVPAPVHHSLAHQAHGTKVTVRDLFGALPVRVKHRTVSRELPSIRQKDWYVLRHAVTGVLLAWNSSVSLTIKTSDGAHKVHFRKGLQYIGRRVKHAEQLDKSSFNIDHLRGILVQGEQCDADSWETWSQVSARTSDLTIRAIVSSQPAPSKSCQFISLGRFWMKNDSGFNVLYDEINNVFAASSFGVDEELRIEESEQLGARKKLRFENGDYTHKELKGRGKGIDRWPMFYVRIEPHHSTNLTRLRNNDSSLEGNKVLQSITEILGSMMTSFLCENHFRVHPRRKRTHNSSLQYPEPDSRIKLGIKADSTNTSYDKGPFLSIQGSTPQTIDQQEDSLSGSVDKERLRVKQRRNDLGSTIVFPKISRSRNLSFQDGVSGWSRIKVARPPDSSVCPETPLEPVMRTAAKSCAEKKHGVLDVSSEEPVLVNPSPSRSVPLHKSEPHNAELVHRTGHQNTDQETPNGLSYCNANLCPQAELSTDTNKEDDPLPWMNPVTKNQVMINSRTGLLMVDLPRPTTPATAAESLPAEPHRLLTKKRKLPRASTESSGFPITGNWAQEFLGSWDNPVFRRNEENIKQVSLSTFSEESGHVLSGRHTRCTHRDIEKAFTELSTAFATKISIRSLGDAMILGQLDKKFILVKATTASPTKNADDAGTTSERKTLVLVDQHAADERFGVEALFKDLCAPPSLQNEGLQTSIGLKSAIETVKLLKPIAVNVNPREVELLKSYAAHFANWGILLDVPPQRQKRHDSSNAPVTPRVYVLSLPPSIAERCCSDIKLLTELLRDEVWGLEERGPQAIVAPKLPGGSNEPWLHRIHTCPPGILNMLNSRSCRSAIMFNDELTREECEMLIRRLAQCQFPFQCAHGRPTMIPFVDLGIANDELDESVGVGVGRSLFTSDRSEEGDLGFVDAWKTWKARKAETDVEDGSI